ncbi:MAG: hypothetical protein IID32_10765 [Planctomycetes bacterium]|nr:hypothetical protein [Planctomycetota bacterium]
MAPVIPPSRNFCGSDTTEATLHTVEPVLRLSDLVSELLREWVERYQAIPEPFGLVQRNIAKVCVDKKALSNAQERGSNMIEENDIVSAFFSEVPKAFYSLMIRLFDEVGFTYDEQETKSDG